MLQLKSVYYWKEMVPNPVHEGSRVGTIVPNNKLKFLYRLLSQREPHQNISHREMPTWAAHVHFVNSRPYTEWYIIEVNDLYIGAIYVTTEDEIGIFIDRKYRGSGFGSIALNMLIKDTHKRPLFANISPKNTRSEKFFVRHGFHIFKAMANDHADIVQYTYKYTVSPDDFYAPD